MNQDEIPLSTLNALNTLYNDQVDNPFLSADFYEAIFSVSQLVTQTLNLTIHKPALAENTDDPTDYLTLIAKNNGLRLRKISLKDAWYLYDIGPLVGFYQGAVCALLPVKNGYDLVDSQTGKRIRLNAAVAKRIDLHAYVFYTSFPQGNLSIIDILKFTFSTLKKDVLAMISLQFFCSLLLLVVPVLTGVIFESVIPSAEVPLLIQYTLFLIAIGIVITLLHFFDMIFLLRIRLKAQQKIQVAIWDRLLKLPLNFFKQFSPGDLSYRCGTITNIQEALGENVISTVLSGLLSVTNLALMFYIDTYLAVVGFIMVLLFAVVSFTFDLIILKQERNIIVQKTRISGLLVSLVHAISKIRMFNKEVDAFQLWGNEFSTKMQSTIKINRYLNRLGVFNLGCMGLSTLIIYSLVIWRGQALNFGQFIVFNAAFVQFASSILALTGIINQSMEIIPLFKIVQPVFHAMPEDASGKNAIDLVDGDIIMQDVVFRYPDTKKPLFVDLNLSIKAGSYVAFVGPSGAGKSTLFRLLLGLEKAESGDIKYNGINLNKIQLQSLREQVGIVMQSTQLIPGTVFDNICGKNQLLTREKAWEIAENVGLSETIHHLPMGMDTLINDGIQTFSGGEIQRINLARAISSSPKILLLDEATSALDNKVQAQIQRFLEQLNITRIVIAHRFSTIVDADRIYVIDKGKVVESGSYKALIAEKGLFYRLSVHQV